MKTGRAFLLLISFIFFTQKTHTQISTTAHDYIPPYETNFAFGVNPGTHPNWTDDQLAELGRTIGINSFRPTLPEHFVRFFGYEIRLDVFQKYIDMGMKDLTVFIGYPSEEIQEIIEHCPGTRSLTFANLYEPIWDNGANGTPVNEENPYALYCYKLAQTYGDYVKFWEIWNEPDFSFTVKALADRGEPGNWWEFNPDPCEHGFRAPITHYIRMLRISYEVIKSMYPDSYICTGGLGYPSYLDAILRQTDNPDGGAVSDEYPLKGGAYFDVMSFHSYPHIDNSMREWSNDIMDFKYFHHSDQAVDGFIRLKREFDEVLSARGYDGSTHPSKIFINTETNMPRHTFDFYYGSNELQRNYLVKTVVACFQEGVQQLHPYTLAELNKMPDAKEPFQTMGFFSQLSSPGQDQSQNPSGIAWHTASLFLENATYDPTTTDQLSLPENIRGGAFTDENGEIIFALWAKTDRNLSETASADFVLPPMFDMPFVELSKWNYSKTRRKSIVSSESIRLNGDPIFIKKAMDLPDDFLQFPKMLAYPNPFRSSINIEMQNPDYGEVAINLTDVQGRMVEQLMPNTFLSPGIHQFNFETENLAAGVYFLTFVNEQKNISIKIVKTN